jgi:hypothetical protein
MSQERNYYDEQFAHRINQIAKPGATPNSAHSASSGGSGWGWKGTGGVGILVVIVIRALVSLGSSSSYSPRTYPYTPPQPITIPAEQFQFPDAKQDAQWQEILRKIQEAQKPANPPLDPFEKQLPPANEGKQPNVQKDAQNEPRPIFRIEKK